MNPFEELIHKQLHKQLSDMQEMTPLVPGDVTDFDEYMVRQERYHHLYENALSLAMYALPTPIYNTLRAIQLQQWVLLGAGSHAQYKAEDTEQGKDTTE